MICGELTYAQRQAARHDALVEQSEISRNQGARHIIDEYLPEGDAKTKLSALPDALVALHVHLQKAAGHGIFYEQPNYQTGQPDYNQRKVFGMKMALRQQGHESVARAVTLAERVLKRHI